MDQAGLSGWGWGAFCSSCTDVWAPRTIPAWVCPCTPGGPGHNRGLSSEGAHLVGPHSGGKGGSLSAMTPALGQGALQAHPHLSPVQTVGALESLKVPRVKTVNEQPSGKERTRREARAPTDKPPREASVHLGHLIPESPAEESAGQWRGRHTGALPPLGPPLPAHSLQPGWGAGVVWGGTHQGPRPPGRRTCGPGGGEAMGGGRAAGHGWEGGVHLTCKGGLASLPPFRAI